MAKPKLYVESTIFSMLTARPSRVATSFALQTWTHRWWDEKRHDYELFISRYVLDEIADGDPEVAARRIELASQCHVIVDTKTSRRFARKLYKALRIPRDARVDAFHVTIAIEGGMDFLLTWNCAHIANPFHQRTIEEMALQRGFAPPIICSPLHYFMGDYDDA